MLTVGGLMVQWMTLGSYSAGMSAMTSFSFGIEGVSSMINSSNGVKEGHGSVAAAATTSTAETRTTATSAPTTLFREDYFSEVDGIFKGILSTKPKSFFQKFQKEIDEFHLEERCRRYGFSMTPREGLPERPNRRIFYGALIAEEPWELVDILATETHGIFEGMVFVESNRTQMLHPRTIN